MKLPAASGRGISGASLGIQSKIEQFELLHPGFRLFLIGALISDVISDCFLRRGFSDSTNIFAGAPKFATP